MEKYEKLMQIAKEASVNAYAPYSKFNVGAALLFEDGTIYKGVNVENSSYGLALCAERNAISSAVAAGQKGLIEAVAIYSPSTVMCSPCGACRQWLHEFEKGQKIKVVLEAEDYSLFVKEIDELLPFGFRL